MSLFQQYFTLSEFNRIRQKEGITTFDVPFDVQEKILQWIFFLNPIRYRLNHPISINTGYRPVWYELDNGRNGSSQHVFRKDGAVDLRSDIMPQRVLFNHLQYNLARLLLDANVGRIIYYPQKRPKYSFFHIDNKVQEDQTITMIVDSGGLRRIQITPLLKEVLKGAA